MQFCYFLKNQIHVCISQSCSNDENQVCVQAGTGTSIIPGRFSLAARRPYVQAPGRTTLTESSNTLQFTAPTPGRVSLSAQRTLPKNYDDFEEHKVQRLSLSTCTPGRVRVTGSKSNLNSVPYKQSFINSTPGRMKGDCDPFSVNGVNATSIRMNLQAAFCDHTDKKNTQSELHTENGKQGSIDSKTETTKTWHDILLGGKDFNSHYSVKVIF